MRRHIPLSTLRTLAEHQITQLIERGVQVEDCQQVWRERWRLEWPYRKRGNGEIVDDRRGG